MFSQFESQPPLLKPFFFFFNKYSLLETTLFRETNVSNLESQGLFYIENLNKS